MSSGLLNESGDMVPLTSVPVSVLSGHADMSLELTSGSGQLVDGSYDSDDLPPSSVGDFPMLFHTYPGFHLALIGETKAEAETASLEVEHSVSEHNVKVPSTSPSPLLLSSEVETSLGKDELGHAPPTQPGSSKPLVQSSSLQLPDTDRTLVDIPVGISGDGLTLSEPGDVKTPFCVSERVRGESGANSVGSPVSLLKSDGGVSALSMGLSEAGDAFDMDLPTAPADKTDVSSSPSIFPEGAVLVETPQGLMLSVGEELRTVTLMEGPDSQGNHLLSISNSGIPVALLSGCQLEEGEGEGPLSSSSDLSLNSEHVMPVGTAQDWEPKRKNRGWPKGKKRKPASLFTAPRAPMTGYVLFAISRRQEIKRSNPDLPFTEVTKVLGQEWSNMDTEKKQKFLDEAENDKQRYIDELKELQKSEMYQNHVKRKRMTGDEIRSDADNDIEEDGDELHCRVCQLYFSSLHNKKEHMLGKQHLQAITEQLKQGLRRQEEEERSSDPLEKMGAGGPCGGQSERGEGSGGGGQGCRCWAQPVNVSGAIADFVHRVYERDQEILRLRGVLHKHSEDKLTIFRQLQDLKAHENKQQQELRGLTAQESVLRERINNLKMVPALFGVEEFL